MSWSVPLVCIFVVVVGVVVWSVFVVNVTSWSEFVYNVTSWSVFVVDCIISWIYAFRVFNVVDVVNFEEIFLGSLVTTG